jgi:hypothetical protein
VKTTKLLRTAVLASAIAASIAGVVEGDNNVRWAVKDMKIDYPIVVDGSSAIWYAFDNQHWPAPYCIDAKGHVRYQQFGEG